MLLSVAEAANAVLSSTFPLARRRIAVRGARGCVLAEPIHSDIDSPPHDKAMVDGFAVVARDLQTGRAEFEVLELVTAGAVPVHSVRSGCAIQIMTGAPIPAGSDAVVMVEKTSAFNNPTRPLTRVWIEESPVKAGQNILPRGVSMRAGDLVLPAGTQLRAAEIGLLAEVGRTEVLAYPAPTVAILSTGNELVPAETQPLPGQIRNSNGPMLTAAAESAGADVIEVATCTDDLASLKRAVESALRADVVILSGGVSAGVLDLVPEVLRSAGVREVFHKVRVKPGKPLWFGVKPRAEGSGSQLVFGLAGNPVGSLIGFELFIRPALRALQGIAEPTAALETAVLAEPFRHKGDRPTYHPAQVMAGSPSTARCLSWKGSADLKTLAGANAFVVFPAGDQDYAAGSELPIYRF